MFILLLIVMSVSWFLAGWFMGRTHEMRKSWRRGLYEHSQYTSKDEVSNADDNPPGSL